MNEEITRKLLEIEKERGVYILYACESGSRAWGFASPDSDYDVRFIYVQPIERYLSIRDERDVIECKIDESLDISGWDLRKALRLMAKSNPPLNEWLGSPTVYLELALRVHELRALAQQFYSPQSCMYHYYHMANGNFKDYLKGEEVWTKKYFYVLRPVLAILWIEHGLGVVPMQFDTLVNKLVWDQDLRSAIDELLVQKRAGAELRKGPRVDVLDAFVRGNLTRWSENDFKFPEEHRTANTQPLDDFFRKSVLP